jgi:protoporphyrinogen oxidase
MTVGILGGGIMGISLGYFLSCQGIDVEIFEASPTLGGLAGPIFLHDGTPVDRFYHAILSSDQHLIELCSELDIDNQLRFKETKMGFYYNQDFFPMNNMIEFLRFPPLGWIDRFRLGLTIVAAQLINDWNSLESVNVEEWLIKLSGERTFHNIWRPMLKAKFDGGFENTPATYIWSRLVRMKSTRGGANQKEEAGHLIGGYITLLNAMAKKIEEAGGKIHLQTPVKEIVINEGKATSLRFLDNSERSYKAIAATVQTPIFHRLIPKASPDYLDYLSRTSYLGIISPLLVLERPLSTFWTLNITDDNIPFTGVIETTSYIDPQYTGGHHLIYLPKYTAPGSEWQQKSDEEIQEIWISNLEKMFSDFNRKNIVQFLIHRERFVEPLHGLNETHLIPQVETPIQNMYLATTAQIYPDLTNGESVSRHARKAAEIIFNKLS